MIFLIFLSHYSVIGHESPLLYGGDCGVAFFFMLSGFILTRAHHAGEKISWTAFLGARLRKIYPLYFLGFACAAIFFWLCPLPQTLATIFMVQSFVPDQTYYFAYNGVEWFLSDMMFFYALFPFLLRIVNRKGFRIIFVALIPIYICLIATIEGGNILSWLYIFPPTRLLCFTAGMVLSSVVKTVRKTTDTEAVAAIACLIATYLICYTLEWRWIYDIVWWPAAALMITVFSTNDGGRITRLLSSSQLVKFGNISFSFYIFHNMLIAKLNVPIQHYLAPGYLSLPVMFAICWAVGYLMNRYVEKPMNKLLVNFNNR